MSTQATPVKQQSSVQQANLLQQLISPGDTVLDLGSFASGTTQALLSRRCRCYVEDLPVFLNEIQIHDDFSFERALSQHLVIANDDVKINVILTWDLFHYLDLSEIGILFKILGDSISPGTIIHSTRYTGRDIPERPQLFKLSDDLSYKMLEKKSSLKVPNYSHATIDLLTELKHFSLNDTLTHSKRFNKGLVEYSLVYSESNKKLKPVRSIFFDIEESIQNNRFKPIKLPNLNKLLVEQLQAPKNCAVDFGTAANSNYEQLTKTANIVLEDDLYASILWQRKTSIGNTFDSTECLLNFRKSVSFDLVLLWDLANFCEPQQFKKIIAKLSQHMTHGALLHLVLPHSGMSAVSPASFRLNDKFEVAYCGDLTGPSGQTVLSTGQLVRLLPGFKVLSYYFGTPEDSGNYQEYLFEYVGIYAG